MPSLRYTSLLVALTAAQMGISNAFIPNSGKANVDVSESRKMASSFPDNEKVSFIDQFQKYGEESREYRRTVYTHEDWVKHRSPDRFTRNLASFASSGIYKSLFREVVATTTAASFIVVWNMIFGQYVDLQGVTQDGLMHDSVIPALSLPLSVFTLSSPSLGLLLIFRTNTSYKRWDEARKNWGMNINHTRDLVRMGNAYYDRRARTPEEAKEDLDQLALATWAFVRSMKRHLSPESEDEEAFKKEMLEKLPEEQAQKIFDAAHRPNRALQDLSTAIENLPMHFMRKDEIHSAATIFEDNLGSSERLLTSPIPLFYSRHTARFLSIWLLLLPLGLWGPLGNTWNHIGLIPTISMLSIFLFGIEELATQLEEPFTILPMQAFCDKIYNWCTEIVSFKPGDNGMPIYYYNNYSSDLEYDSNNVAKPIVSEKEPAVVEDREIVLTEEKEEDVSVEEEEEVFERPEIAMGYAEASKKQYVVKPAVGTSDEDSSENVGGGRRRDRIRNMFRKSA